MMKLWNDSDETIGGSVPKRSQVKQEDTWDLTPLYVDDPAWEKAFDQLGATFEKVSGFKGTIGQSAHRLCEVLEFEKSIQMELDQLNQYTALRVTEDSGNDASLTREARLQNLYLRIGEAFSFLRPEIQAIPDEQFDVFLRDPILKDWLIFLKKLRRLKPHTLTPDEERLLALAGATLAGHEETFSQLTNVDLKFGKVVDSKGKEKPLTQSSLASFMEDSDRQVRQTAFHQFYKGFSDHKFTLASTLANSVRADVFYARARNYPSAREAALFKDHIPVSVYENLIASVHSGLKPLYRYYNLRKSVLKLKEIHAYDNNVPLVDDVKTHVSFDDAIETVAGSLSVLGSDYVDTLRKGLKDKRWCDRYENEGKRSGAFSYGTYTSPPYIMMNYKEDVFSDVYTLAHEAGHSMHTWYSQRAQNYQDYHYPIFLAEVASTFNECLLTHHLLEKTEDKAMRAYLISRQLNDIRSTLHRQTMFAEFERNVHQVDEQGGALTLDEFRRIYRGLLEKYFGPDFTLDDELELECLRIPHFYSAFYVYKYATGLSAAIALSEQVIQSGDATSYLAFLKSGCSRFPIETLKLAGVDMSTPEPVDAALSLFAKRVEELEHLLL